jgi:hypothetical protein
MKSAYSDAGAANMLGVAVAEAPTGTPLRTISVQGTATLPIGQGDNAAAATAVYREGMAGAVTDGQSKAASGLHDQLASR